MEELQNVDGKWVSLADYPDELRLVEADVEVDGKLVTMTFITNNLEWAPSSIAELYKARWAIEVFFKEIKQNLQLLIRQ